MQNNNSIDSCATNDEIANAVFSLYPNLPDDYPIAYKTKKWFFCGLPFHVNKNVLIPRADTEVLVQAVLDIVKPNDTILDMCTGSGCIAITLAKTTDTKVIGADISWRALRIAKKNAKTNNVHIDFIQSDLFRHPWRRIEYSVLSALTFDIITCNPPYIKSHEIGKYDKSILCEPKIALDGGRDGLEFYKRLSTDALKHMKAGGHLVLEIGHDQAEDVTKILQNSGWYDIKVIKDQQGQNRVIICTKN